jgi:uncharacterized protein with von Willebrand factor type A (vWA) domain
MSDAQQLELNKGDQFIGLIDVSASMGMTDTPSGANRLEYAKEKYATLIREATNWDPDGVDLLSFGHRVTHLGKATPDNLDSILRPLKPNESSTDTTGAIKAAFELHRANGHKQTVVFICTDGEPADPEGVLKTIADITHQIKDEYEFALSFLTVGQRTAALEKFLEVLDDGVPNAKSDIVDVKKLEDVDFHAAFAGALHD